MRMCRLILILIISIMTINLFAFGHNESNNDRNTLDIQRIEYTNITSLKIDNESTFDIKVTGTDENLLSGEFISEDLRGYEIQTYRDDGELFIRITSKRRLFRDKPDINEINLNVPKNIELTIDTETGIILVENCSGFKDLRAETGEICVVNSTGNINAYNETGDLIFGNIKGNINADTETGNILAYGLNGALNLKTDTGHIEGDLIELTGNSDFNTDTGTININFINSLSELSYDIDTDTGTILLDTIQSMGVYKMNSGEILVKAKSETGDIIFK